MLVRLCNVQYLSDVMSLGFMTIRLDQATETNKENTFGRHHLALYCIPSYSITKMWSLHVPTNYKFGYNPQYL